MKQHLLATTFIVLFVAGIVTLNLNSAVWAKDDNKINSKDNFRMFDIIDGKENTQTNDNGNTQTDSTNLKINNKGSHSCDSECQKTIDDAMDMIDNLF